MVSQWSSFSLRNLPLLCFNTVSNSLPDHIIGDQDSNGAAQLMTSHDLPEALQTQEWSPADATMYRVLREIYPFNFCSVSKLLKTRTCQQVCGVFRWLDYIPRHLYMRSHRLKFVSTYQILVQFCELNLLVLVSLLSPML